MPSQAANLAAMRAPGHQTDVYIGTWNPDVVVQGTLTAVPANKDLTFAYTRTAGTASNAKPGFLVKVFDSSTGDLKYETAIRKVGTPSNSSLPILEFGKGAADLSIGDVVKVYNLVALVYSLPAADATFAPDHETYSAQNSTIKPICCSGGPFMYYLLAGVTTVNVAFKGDTSYTVDPDSGGSITHSWTAATASGSTTSSSANPTFTFAVGFHNVVHVVTDSSNSTTETQYIPVQIFNDANPPLLLTQAENNLDLLSGGRFRFGARDNVSLTALPPRAMCCLFVRETINGSEQSFGNVVTGHSHMKYIGFLATCESELDGEEDIPVFELVSPFQRLMELNGFSQVFTSATSPDEWNELQTLSVKRAIIQLIRYYTTYVGLFDWIFNTFDDRTYPQLFIQTQTVGQQIVELARGNQGRLTCDRTGRFMVQKRPTMMPFSERSALTTQLAFTTADIAIDRGGVQVREVYFNSIAYVEVRGFSGDTSSPTPFLARSPGVPQMGASIIVEERLIFSASTSQVDANQAAGMLWGESAGCYIDSHGWLLPAIEVTLNLRGSYDALDPAYQEWFTLPNIANNRGFDLTRYRFLLLSVQVVYEDGTAYSQLKLRSETRGPAGAVQPPPTENNNGIGDTDDPNDESPAIVITIPTGVNVVKLYKGTQRIAVFDPSNLYKTTVFGSGAATTWTGFSWSSVFGITGTPITWIPDGFNPGKGWLNTNQRIYYVDLVANTATLKHTFTTTSSFWGGDASFGQANHVLWSQGTEVVYTTDNSAFTRVAAGSGGLPSAGGTVGERVGVYYSPRSADTIIAAFFKTANFAVGYRSTDAGANWTELTNPRIESGSTESIEALVFPYASLDTLCFFGSRGNLVGELKVPYRSNSTTPVKIKPSGFVANTDHIFARGGIASYVGNSNLLIVCGYLDAQVWLTRNALATTPTWTQINSGEYSRAYWSGDNANTAYFIGLDSTGGSIVGLMTDGATIVPQDGDLPLVADLFSLAGY